MASVARDFRHALRCLWVHPASTTAAVLSLALVIGLTTAVFGVLNAVLLKPFPYHKAEELVVIWGSRAFDVRPGIAGEDLERWRAEGRGAEEVSAFQLSPSRIAVGTDEADSVVGAYIGTRTFAVLKVRPFMGRTFGDGEEIEHRRVVLSNRVWTDRFGKDPQIIGRSVSINGDLHTVIGVMQPDFFFPDVDTDLWLPLARQSALFGQVHGIARLRPGVKIDQAQAELDALFAPSGRRNEGGTAGAFSLHRLIIRDYDTASWALLSASILLMLAACGNVANVLLARRLSRSRELAIRVSLGAKRRDLVRLMFFEPLILSFVAGILGVVLATIALSGLQRLRLRDVPRIESAGIDLNVLLFAVCLSLSTAVAVGLAPATGRLWSTPFSLLQGGGHATQPRRLGELRYLIMALQVAITSVLLVGASLLTASFALRSRSEWGFDPTNVLLAEVTLPTALSRVTEIRNEYIEKLLASFKTVPEAISYGMSSGVPVRWSQWGITHISVEGRAIDDFTAATWTVSPGYFRTMGIPVIAGREYEARDAAAGERLVLINKALANRLWPQGESVGRLITVLRPSEGMRRAVEEARRRGVSVRDIPLLIHSSWEADGPPWRVIGEVGNTRMFGLESSPPPAMFLHFRQNTTAALRSLKFVARTSTDPTKSADAVRSHIVQTDPSVRIDGISTMGEIVSRSVGGRGTTKLLFVVSAIVGALSMWVVGMGVYGVTVFIVERRTREIGIRRALGAGSVEVVRRIFRDAMRSLLLGLALGLVGAASLTSFLKGFLFGVSSLDVRVFVAVVVVVLLAASIAVLQPALRAVKVNPADVLHRD